MTEEEALTKWCPFARDSNTGGNRLRYGSGAADAPPPEYGSEAAAEFPCIASACMAWRWKLPADERRYPNSAWAEERRDHGFCGLAGAVR
jgi:hypothetical protein